jgi:alpha,alpha-trehalase
MSIDVSPEDWCIRYDHYNAGDEGRREALFALGNGYLVSRAAVPEGADDGIHYPGTYRVGCYNRLTSIIEGKEVENESLVNLPNWLPLSFRINGSSWFSMDKVEILSYQQELNMKQAVLHRKVYFRDRQGRLTKLRERRFVSMAQPHLMALEMELTAVNWSGELEVKSALNGNIVNNNVERYAPFNSRHLESLFTRQKDQDTMELKTRTVQSKIEIALAARTLLQVKGRTANISRSMKVERDCITAFLQVSMQAGEQVLIEKTASLYTSRDLAIADCSEAAYKTLERAQYFNTLIKAHAICWEQLWRRCSINVNNKDHLRYFRLHIFQIMQNISLHTAELDVGVPPSGWQGEEYHGHIFWDELFIFPFLTFRFPTIARSLLLYRYRRLDEARHRAKQQGYRGAMFPWRSASTGREETPQLQFNLLSGQWMKDHTYLQRHINAIIAFNVYQYVRVTDDQVFLAEYGAELLLEIARFWASIAQFNQEQDRYEIHGVVGPDEYHTQYPGGEIKGVAKQGVDNNSYTNIIAAWTLRYACQVWGGLSPQLRKDLSERLSFSKGEPGHWEEVSRKMRIIFQEDGILSPFEGFSSLKRFDLEQFRKEYGQQRIDWTLEAMGDSVERYQVSKQADTSLLLYLFSPVELIELINYMGYTADQDMLERTVQYDIAHTAHESSLSRIVYAGALARLDAKASWKCFQEAQLIDLLPEEDKGASEGVHLGAMGGTLKVLQQHYLGLKVQLSGVLEVDPALPEEMEWVQITLFFRGVEIKCEATCSRISLRSVQLNAEQVKVSYRSHTKILCAGTSITFDLIK